MQKRDKATLISIIKNNVKLGCQIVSHEWRAYLSLNKLGYTHYTVINPYTTIINPSRLNTKIGSKMTVCIFLESIKF